MYMNQIRCLIFLPLILRSALGEGGHDDYSEIKNNVNLHVGFGINNGFAVSNLYIFLISLVVSQ